jgi:CRISPR-associated protein Csm1
VSKPLPTLAEVSLGAFLHDIGKFMQRAYGSLAAMDPAVRAREHEVLPVASAGFSTHKHALWTDAFFHELEKRGVVSLGGSDLARVRNLAVYHHRPSPNIALTELITQADRLSAALDRKERDERDEIEAERGGWDSFIRTALKNPFSGVDLSIGQGKVPPSEIALQQLIPGESLLPVREVDTSSYGTRYRELWEAFLSDFVAATALPSADLFAEAALSLSERYMFAVPSSTRDEPDISLYDHQRTAAALAAALYLWHERDGSLEDERRIRDALLKKFRFLAGDLSGIQRSLFRLAAEQVQGLNKILRARSLLMALTGEAAALACRRLFDLPVFSVLQNAGGRFLLLAPNLGDIDERLEPLRREIDEWMRERYLGDLALNLALSEPFSGEELQRENFRRLIASLSLAIERSKLKPFSSGPISAVAPVEFPAGVCPACGWRPAPAEGERCRACRQEFELGGALPRLESLAWVEQPAGRIAFFGRLALDWNFKDQRPGADWLSFFRLAGETADGPLPVRFLANYIPVLDRDEKDKRVYRELLSEDQEVEPGDPKTFEHLALDAVEECAGELKGEPLLAVLKGDVDRLGAIFSWGLKDLTLSRFAALSRMMDLFFTGYLTYLLRKRFPSTYTVYAGGDDMLLIGPWRQMLELASRLRQDFEKWTGGNPNVTLSAGVELVKPMHPVGPAAGRAEERLERAKREKNLICAIAPEAVSWEDFSGALGQAETLSNWLRDGSVHPIFLLRLLYFWEQRLAAEPRDGRPIDLRAASWQARWGYYLARHLARLGEERSARAEEIRALTNQLLGLDRDLRRCEAPPPPRVAVTIALYRNRIPRKEERR